MVDSVGGPGIGNHRVSFPLLRGYFVLIVDLDPTDEYRENFEQGQESTWVPTPV